MASASDLHLPAGLPASLPLKPFSARTAWRRIHKNTLDPVFFGPQADSPPVNRFDAPTGEYRVLYVGLSFSAAFVETMIRLPQLPYLKRSAIEERSASILKNSLDLQLIDLRGGGLSRIGADNRLTTGSYLVASQWALKLWEHPSNADGILYRSRQDPNLLCAALFDRRRARYTVESTEPLLALTSHWVPILRAHGKGVV